MLKFTAQILTVFLVLTITIPVSATPAIEDDASSFTAKDWVIIKFARYMHYGKSKIRGETITSFYPIKDKFIKLYDQVDFRADGISQEDIDSFRSLSPHLLRGGYMLFLSQFFINDLNMDLTVTKEEIERAAHLSFIHKKTRIGSKRNLASKRSKKVMKAFLKADINGDEVVTIFEMRDFVLKMRDGIRPTIRARTKAIPMLFDTNDDYIVSKQEYETILAQVFAELDADGDGELSNDEQRKFQKLNEVARLRLNRSK